MANILIVANSQAYLMGNIKNQLQLLDYQVDEAKYNVQSVYDNLHNPEAIILNVEENYEELTQVMMYIADRALEISTPIFLVGDVSDIEGAKHYITSSKALMCFNRPVDVKEVAKAVNDFIINNGRGQKKKILVVDDSGAVLRNVKGWLEDKYLLTLANSGATAIKSLSLNRPDLVLLDYEMPVVDGSQVLEMMKTEQDFCDIPVIFLTSKGDKETVMKVMALKPDGYLLKTLPPADIIKAIDDFFEKQKYKNM